MGSGAAAGASAAQEPQEPVDSEYITIGETEEARKKGAPVAIVDARSARTYEDSDQEIPGAVRLDPDQAVRTAARLELPKRGILAVLCA
jgi:3-mercaptopyruvate sulfurtransferase SseA